MQRDHLNGIALGQLGQDVEQQHQGRRRHLDGMKLVLAIQHLDPLGGLLRGSQESCKGLSAAPGSLNLSFGRKGDPVLERK